VELHTAEDCRIESMQAVSEAQVTSGTPIKPRRATVQLLAVAVSARGCCGFVGGAEVVGGGMGAKLSVEDAEQEGATHRGRSSSQLCPSFALLHHTRHWRDRVTGHCDSTRFFSTHLFLLLHVRALGIGAAVVVV
jgi:hypothetical protein